MISQNDYIHILTQCLLSDSESPESVEPVILDQELEYEFVC